MGTSGDPGGSLRLREAIEQDADSSGFVPFDRFMEAALYAPMVGYYERPTSPLGFAGDFYTAPQLHSVFGATLGQHVSRVLKGLDVNGSLRIVELGPGDGELAASVISEVIRSAPQGPRIEYLLVERSERRASTALARAKLPAEGSRVVVRRAGALGEEGPFEGVVLGHEFWDAQPVRRFRHGANGWEELGVRSEAGHWVEVGRPVAAHEEPAGLPTDLEEGSVVEISPRAEASVREVADHLVRGRAIFVDYGAEQAEILRTHRFGTLTALRHHEVLDSVLDRPGEVDLSAYVNFSRIRSSAARAGLKVAADRTQAEALVAWGLEEAKARWDDQADATEALRLHMAVKNLLFGFANFRALELVPGSAVPR